MAVATEIWRGSARWDPELAEEGGVRGGSVEDQEVEVGGTQLW